MFWDQAEVATRHRFCQERQNENVDEAWERVEVRTHDLREEEYGQTVYVCGEKVPGKPVRVAWGANSSLDGAQQSKLSPTKV